MRPRQPADAGDREDQRSELQIGHLPRIIGARTRRAYSVPTVRCAEESEDFLDKTARTSGENSSKALPPMRPRNPSPVRITARSTVASLSARQVFDRKVRPGDGDKSGVSRHCASIAVLRQEGHLHDVSDTVSERSSGIAFVARIFAP